LIHTLPICMYNSQKWILSFLLVVLVSTGCTRRLTRNQTDNIAWTVLGAVAAERSGEFNKADWKLIASEETNGVAAFLFSGPNFHEQTAISINRSNGSIIVQ